MKKELFILYNEIISVLLIAVTCNEYLINPARSSIFINMIFVVSIILLVIPLLTYRLADDFMSNSALLDITLGIVFFLTPHYRQELVDILNISVLVKAIPMGIIYTSLLNIYITFSRFSETDRVKKVKKITIAIIWLTVVLVFFKPELFNLMMGLNICLVIGAGVYIYRNETAKITRDSRYEQMILIVCAILSALPVLFFNSPLKDLLASYAPICLILLLSLPLGISFVLIKRTYPDLTVFRFFSRGILIIVSLLLVLYFSFEIVELTFVQFAVILIVFLGLYVLVRLFSLVRRFFAKEKAPKAQGHITLEEFLVEFSQQLEDRLDFISGLGDYSFILDQSGHRIKILTHTDGQVLPNLVKSQNYNEFTGLLYYEADLDQTEIDKLEDIVQQYTKLVSQFYTLSSLGSLERDNIQSQGLRVIEQESKEIADFIHDNVLQDILGLIRLVEALETDQVELKEQILSIMENSAKSLRTKMNELSPTNIKEVGLRQGLFELSIMLNASQDKTQVRFKAETELRVPDDEVFVIYRCVQELTRNALKHAEADTVTITADQSDFYLKISVNDDGKGFDTSEKLDSKDSYGLFSIRRDLSLVNGELDLNSSPGQGSQATIVIPVKNYY